MTDRHAGVNRVTWGFYRRDGWSKWHRLIGEESLRCGTPTTERIGTTTTNANPPGRPSELCLRCFPGRATR